MFGMFQICSLVNMGRHFGDLAKVRHVITYSLSPFEQRAFPNYFSKGLPNVWRRFTASFFKVAPREFLNDLAVILFIFDPFWFSCYWFYTIRHQCLYMLIWTSNVYIKCFLLSWIRNTLLSACLAFSKNKVNIWLYQNQGLNIC